MSSEKVKLPCFHSRTSIHTYVRTHICTCRQADMHACTENYGCMYTNMQLWRVKTDWKHALRAVPDMHCVFRELYMRLKLEWDRKTWSSYLKTFVHAWITETNNRPSTTCTLIQAYTHTHTHTHVDRNTSMHTHVRISRWTDTNYRHTCMHTHTIHACTHTQTCRGRERER